MELKMTVKMKPELGLFITPALKEALQVLAMPLSSLEAWIEKQLEENPALTRSEAVYPHLEEPYILHHTRKRQEIFQKEDLAYQYPCLIEGIANPAKTLQEELLSQGRELSLSHRDRAELEELIYQLDDRGFLAEELQSHPLTPLLHTFDPVGVGASSLRHCLLLQLKRLGKEKREAFKIIQHYYNELLQGKLITIAEGLDCSLKELRSIIQEDLASLCLNPAKSFHRDVMPVEMPDAFISYHEGKWMIELNEQLTSFHINQDAVFEGSHFKKSALWVQEMISRRGMILRKIIGWALEKQRDFFEGRASVLTPLTLQTAAKELSLHLSTISRGVKDKYLSLPTGIFPLRAFFVRKSLSEKMSHDALKTKILYFVKQESLLSPLSDQKIADQLVLEGIACSRRVVTKYRKKLDIPCASKRRRRDFV
ncbi:hypothetical protein [Rhabdochlamydiaceae symbiont of Dictyostelium giganteum]|uniref:RNA polymerase factor sigma-54 n=1 Tax=Rhabdochlamydiaceae symbiont of Dictyostelium giganteum TaxID=3342349 RepID=UPI00384D378B